MKAPVHPADVTPANPACAGTDLASREAVIERGLGTFIEVGNALVGIREDRQYRDAGWETFEGYCRERWQISDSRARQLIAATQTVTTVTVAGLPAPSSERVARELVASPVPTDVWAEAVERHGPKPTAAQVREVVRAEVVGAPERDPAADWFKAGTQDHKDAKSELFRIDSAVKPCLKVDWELLSHQVVRMTKLERQSLAGSASVLEATARFLRQTLETKLEVVK